MFDRGLSLSLQAIHRQLTAMPCERYLIRLIHHHSRKPLPGSRLWTASQLGEESIVRFLRVRNRDGYDVYFQPYSLRSNAGYILVDLGRAWGAQCHARAGPSAMHSGGNQSRSPPGLGPCEHPSAAAGSGHRRRPPIGVLVSW